MSSCLIQLHTRTIWMPTTYVAPLHSPPGEGFGPSKMHSRNFPDALCISLYLVRQNHVNQVTKVQWQRRNPNEEHRNVERIIETPTPMSLIQHSKTCDGTCNAATTCLHLPTTLPFKHPLFQLVRGDCLDTIHSKAQLCSFWTRISPPNPEIILELFVGSLCDLKTIRTDHFWPDSDFHFTDFSPSGRSLPSTNDLEKLSMQPCRAQHEGAIPRLLVEFGKGIIQYHSSWWRINTFETLDGIISSFLRYLGQNKKLLSVVDLIRVLAVTQAYLWYQRKLRASCK